MAKKPKPRAPLPTGLEAEISPVVAALENARAVALQTDTPATSPYILEHPSPEVREASAGQIDWERLERIRLAYEAWHQRLYAEGSTNLFMNAVRAALDKCATDSEFIPIVQAMLADHTRQLVRRGIDASNSGRASNAGDANAKAQAGALTIRNEKIRSEGAKIAKERGARNVANTLAERHGISASQIRKILKE